MDWLEKLAAERRAADPSYPDIEAQIEAEDGGYEIELVTDAEGNVLVPAVVVTAGDSKGVYHL